MQFHLNSFPLVVVHKNMNLHNWTNILNKKIYINKYIKVDSIIIIKNVARYLYIA